MAVFSKNRKDMKVKKAVKAVDTSDRLRREAEQQRMKDEALMRLYPDTGKEYSLQQMQRRSFLLDKKIRLEEEIIDLFQERRRVARYNMMTRKEEKHLVAKEEVDGANGSVVVRRYHWWNKQGEVTLRGRILRKVKAELEGKVPERKSRFNQEEASA